MSILWWETALFFSKYVDEMEWNCLGSWVF